MTIVVVNNKNYYTRHHERRSRTTKRMPKIVKWLQHIKVTHALAFCVCSVDIPGPPLAYVSYPRDVTRTHNMSSSCVTARQHQLGALAILHLVEANVALTCACSSFLLLLLALALPCSLFIRLKVRVRARVTYVFLFGLSGIGSKDFPPWNSLKSVNRDFRGRDFPPEFFFPSPGRGRTELILPGTS